MARNELFAGLFILGCSNGLAAKGLQSIRAHGFTAAAFSTFDTSVIVWIACITGVGLVLRERAAALRSTDVAIGAVFLIFTFLPIGPASWLAVSGLSFYILYLTDSLAFWRRGAVILGTATVPMLWAPLLFHFFANGILVADAALVSALLGTPRTGNIVRFADQSGNLVVWWSCSSLPNASLAMLCWVTIRQYIGPGWSIRDTLWCVLVCLSVVTVNVLRMGLMGLNQSFYDTIHNPWGEAAVNFILVCVMIGVSLLGVRREVLLRA